MKLTVKNQVENENWNLLSELDNDKNDKNPLTS